MGAPVQGRGNRRGNFARTFPKIRQPPPPLRPPLNGFGFDPMMRGPPRGHFRPPMRPPMLPPQMPPRWMRPRGPPIPPPRMMGPRMPPMRPPMMRPPLPPPPHMGHFRPRMHNRVQKGRIVKRGGQRRGPEIDLTKEWVTQALREEFKKKEELLKKAKSTENKDDWAVYRGQREKCNQMYQAAETEHMGQQEVGTSDSNTGANFLESNPNSSDSETDSSEYDTSFAEDGSMFYDYSGEVGMYEEFFSCDVCEVDFPTKNDQLRHMAGHKCCSIDGCHFSASAQTLERHIEEQHVTGLYDKIRLKNNTPEEIAKWIQERRVRYPSKENIQKRYEEQEAKMNRGEKIGPRKNRFGKDRTRLTQLKQKSSNKLKQKFQNRPRKQQAKESLIDEKCDWNGTMFPFRGTKELYEEEPAKEDSQIEYEDDEWRQDSATRESTSKCQLNNALGALMGAYQSSEEEIDEGDAPIEEKIVKEAQPFEEQEAATETHVNTDRKKRKRIVKGKKRKRTDRVKSSEVPIKTGGPGSSLSHLKFVKKRVTLLEKLLDNEIRHERNVLLQCVQFVVNNNFFRS